MQKNKIPNISLICANLNKLTQTCSKLTQKCLGVPNAHRDSVFELFFIIARKLDIIKEKELNIDVIKINHMLQNTRESFPNLKLLPIQYESMTKMWGSPKLHLVPNCTNPFEIYLTEMFNIFDYDETQFVEN